MSQMIAINLLDWREARREARKQRFFAALGAGALVSAVIVYAVMSLYNQAIDHQEARNQLLKDEIARIDKQIKEIKELERTRDNLITRMRIIEELQQSRAQVVHFFDQIVETLPEGVYLTSLKQKTDRTTVTGIAESNGRVSSYMVNIDDSPWFSDPQLVVIKSKSENQRRFADFTLTFKVLKQREDEANTGDEAADGGGQAS